MTTLNLGRVVGRDGAPGQDGEDGRGIVSILKTATQGNVDTYTITYTDNTTSTFDVTNGLDGQDGAAGQDGEDGRGIVSIIKTATVGLVDTYTITYTDNTTSTFEVTNGSGGGGGATSFAAVTNYKGKILNVLGDSQTEANYHKTKIYHDWLKELLGFATVNNYGISGSTIGYNASRNPMVTRYTKMSNDADFVIVMGGINDLNNNRSGETTSNVPLGTISDTTYDTFYGALKILCEGLIAKYPTKQILFITPTEVNGRWYSDGTQKRVPEGVTVQQYVNAMIEVCEMYSIPVYDAFGKLGVYAKDSSQNSTYLSDGLHLNNAGHELLGKGLYNFILSLSRTEVSYESTTPEIVPVTGVSLNKNSLALAPQETSSLVASIAPSNATDKTVTWTTSSNKVTLTPNGLNCTVTGVSDGNATVTVTTNDGSYTATCSVVVSSTIAVTGVALNKSTESLGIGDTTTLTATISPANATNKNVTWSANNQNVALTPNGLSCEVEGATAGTSVVTVTTTDGSFTATCNITISAAPIPVTAIALDKSTSSLEEGETEQLSVTFTPSDATDKSLTWTSSDSTVATVSSTGLVTAVGEGTATITATTTNNISDSCTYTVTTLVNPWIGKTVTVSKQSGKSSNASLTALFPMDSDFNSGNYISYEINGINVTNMISNSSLNTGGIFTDTTGEIANGAFTGQIGQGFYASNTVTGTNFVGTNTPFRISSTATTPYVKVAMPITGNPTYSFEITKLNIIVNGVKKIPTKLGAFFASDKEIITVE